MNVEYIDIGSAEFLERLLKRYMHVLGAVSAVVDLDSDGLVGALILGRVLCNR